MSLKVLILGVNGFIGSNLSQRILETTDWSVYGMDVQRDKIEELIGNPRFHYVEGDITINREWIQYHVKKCDVVLPLVALIAALALVLVWQTEHRLAMERLVSTSSLSSI